MWASAGVKRSNLPASKAKWAPDGFHGGPLVFAHMGLGGHSVGGLTALAAAWWTPLGLAGWAGPAA